MGMGVLTGANGGNGEMQRHQQLGLRCSVSLLSLSIENEVIQDAGHTPYLEKPEQFLACLLKHLAKSSVADG
jgi:hypothetical protein